GPQACQSRLDGSRFGKVRQRQREGLSRVVDALDPLALVDRIPNDLPEKVAFRPYGRIGPEILGGDARLLDDAIHNRQEFDSIVVVRDRFQKDRHLWPGQLGEKLTLS